MAFDVKGNELKEGDTVLLKGKIVKSKEGSETVTVETSEPHDRPGMKTTLAIRASSLQKA